MTNAINTQRINAIFQDAGKTRAWLEGPVVIAARWKPPRRSRDVAATTSAKHAENNSQF